MNRLKAIKDFKDFLNSNYKEIADTIIPIEDLSDDDEWLQDNEWDNEYNQTDIINQN